MKKIIFLLFIGQVLFSQTPVVTIHSQTCNSVVFKIQKTGVSNGNHTLCYYDSSTSSVVFDINSCGGLYGSPQTTISFTSGIGYYTLDTTGKCGSLFFLINKFGSESYLSLPQESRPSAGVYKDCAAYINNPYFSSNIYDYNPLQWPFTSLSSTQNNSCANKDLYLKLNDYLEPNWPIPASSGNILSSHYRVHYTLSGANTGSFTSIVNNIDRTFYNSLPFPAMFDPAYAYVSENRLLKIPGNILTNPGPTTITFTRFDILYPINYQDTPLESSNGLNCNSDSLFSTSYTKNITVIASPNLSGTNSVTVTQPLCLTNSGSVTFNSSLLANGTYNLAYTLSGANTGSFTASNVSIASGTGTFSIPSSQLTASGNTTISITAVIDTATGCSSSSTIQTSFSIENLPDLSGTNSVSAIDICLNGDGSVVVSSTSLTNNTYNLNYTLSGTNTGSFTASNVVFTNGSGTFTIPASRLTNLGTTTITISNISNSTTNCQSSF